MADNLTNQILKDLREKQQNLQQTSSPTLQQTNQTGQSLFDQLSSSLDQEVIPSDRKSGALHGVGALMWNALDSALVGVPGIAAKKITGERPYDVMAGKTEGLATAGAIAGQAIGFMAPMKYIGMGVRGTVSAVNKVGTSKIIGEAAEQASNFASKGTFGLEKEIVQRAVKRGLKDPAMKGPGGALSKYELSLDEIAKVENQVKGSIFNSLKKEFAEASDDALLEITNTATNSLKSKGVHVNNLTDIIETGLNTTLGVKTKSSITRYAARAAETGTTFGVYNLIQDGVLSMAGEKDFDPVSDVTDAFLFSAFIPAIDMIPGGGKVHIYQAAKRLRKGMKKVKERNYDDLTKEQANGLLKILTRDSYLKDTLIGSTAKKYSYKQLEKEEAVSAIKKVIGQVNVNTMWKTFAREAKDDFSKSLGRMLVGGLYFDTHAIMDTNLIRAMSGEELATHILVGAFFSKVRRPLFPEKYQHINSEFNDRQRGLEYLGLDASSLEHYGRAFSEDMHWGATYSGILGNDVVQKIESIFEKQEYRDQQEGENFKGTIGSLSDIPGRDKLALHAHDLYKMAALSRNLTSARAGESFIRLESLTSDQVREIAEQLSKVKINETDNLTIDNFNDFKDNVINQSLSNVGILHLEAMRDIADKINLQYDNPPEGKFDIDTPFRMARLDGVLDNQKFGDSNFHELSVFSNLREKLQESGLIENIKLPFKEMIDINSVANDKKTKSFIKKRIDVLMKQITDENYGENYPEQIDPIENTFLEAISSYKRSKKRNALYNIAEGDLTKLKPREKELYSILKEQFGNKVPKLGDGNRVLLYKDDDVTDKEYNKSELDGSLLDIENQINLLARVWGTGSGKTEGQLAAAENGKLPYSKAKDIVESFRAQGYEMSKNIVDEQQRWHYSRILNSPNITSKHLSILENAMALNFARVEKRENERPVLILPDKIAVRNVLLDEKADVNAYLKKYDKVMDSLREITGDYVDISNEVELKQTENFQAAIDEMFRMTGSFNREIYNNYKDIINTNKSDLGKLSNIQDVIDKLFIVDPIDGSVERKVVDDEALLLDLQMKLDNIQKNPPEFVSKDVLVNLKKLRDTITQEQTDERRTRGVTTVAKIIEDSIRDNFVQLKSQTDVFDEILFSSQNFSYDMAQLRNRTDRLTSRLKKTLERDFDTIMPPSANLKSIINQFNKKGKTDKVTKMLINHLEVWNKGYEETTYFEMQSKEQERLGDYSTQLTKKQQDVSPSTITSRYEKFNPNLSSDNFKDILDVHNDAQNRTERKEARKNIRNEIIEAIRIKHNVDSDIRERDLPKEFAKERQEFLENTYPQLILQQIGREYVPSVELFQNTNSSPVLEVSRTIVGKGLVSEFYKEMKAEGIDVLMLQKTATWDGRKRNINDIQNLESIIKLSSLQNKIDNQVKQVGRGEEIKEEASLTDKFQDPVRVPVSQNVELIIGNSTMDGRLSRKFKQWYNNKIKELNNNQPKGFEDVIKNLEIIYGDFISNDNKPISRMDAKQMVRAMYWDQVSSKGLNDIIAVADNYSQMQSLASSFFKYVSLAEATGAKSQASAEFLKVMKEDGFLSDAQKEAIDYYETRKGLNIVGIGDETGGSALDAQYIIKNKLKELKELGNISSEQSDAVGTLLKSLESSSMNAQSYLGTKAAHLLYLHKGRKIDESSNKFGTAGVKPTGWFNKNGESILLKTNFVYDPAIATVLDKADIDLITTQSAAKSFNREYIEINKNEYDGMKNKDALDVVELASKKKGSRNVAQIELENLFLGKVEDSKSLTNVTYALSDFLPESGYKSFLNDFVDYDNMIDNHLGKLSSIISGDKDALGTARFLMGELSEQNALFEQSSDGLLNQQIRAGLDPNSVLANETLKRIAVRGMVNSLRKPKTNGASYSVLIPYIEGSIPIYENINDPSTRKQIMTGGKKLSYDDGQSKIGNVNKVQYVITINEPIKKGEKSKKRDVQLGRNNLGKWVVQDPYNTANEKSLKKQINKIQEFESKHKNNRTLKTIHNELNLFNQSKDSKSLDTKIFLHSLSLRMPNLGGDVAVHKVEGFYRREQGNVVGVNAFDIAQIHQADFDVDAMFSYNTKPTDISNVVYSESGLSLDAYIFPSENFSMDIFGFGDKGIGRAGRAYTSGDNLDKHIQAFHQSKINFGVAKKLATQLSGYLRRPELIDFGGKVKQIKSTEREDFSHFLQGYKNTLQSIIDAAKKPNFVSEAKQDEILRYILFADKPENYNIQDKEKDFYQDKFKGFFQVSPDLKPPQQAIMKDAIIEIIQTQARTQRVLTDVFDVAGRRPPDANEIGMIKSELNNFYRNPNKFIYDRLRYKYRGKQNQLVKLNQLFYGKDLNSLQDWIELKKNLDPTEDVIFIDPTKIQALKDNTISSYIVSRFSQDKANLQGFSNRTTRKGSIARDQAQEILERIDIATSLTGNEDDLAIRETLGDEGFTNGLFLDNVFKSFKKGQTINESQLRDYSLLFSALQKDSNSLQRFIEKAGKYDSASIGRARRKLNHVQNTLDYISSMESDLMKKITSGDKESYGKLIDKYHIQTRNFKNKTGRIFNSSTNPIYVYKRVDKGGRTYFKQSGWVAPKRSMQFSYGEFHVLKNPIRYEEMSKSDFLDAYSLISVTGDIQIQHLGFDSEIKELSFSRDFDQLSRTFGSLISNTIKYNKNNPNSKENWSLEREQEDALVKDFVEKYSTTDNSSDDMNFTESQLSDLTRYMMKPEQVFGTFVVSKNKDIRLPAYKINKRMVNAVSRYLLNHGHKDLFDAIYKEYGKEYRRRVHNVIPENTASMFKSKLYHKDDSYFRTKDDPTLELLVDNNMLYDMPSMQNHYKPELSRKADITKSKYDMDGNLEYVLKYGTYKQVIPEIEFYRDNKNFMEKENKNEKECW